MMVSGDTELTFAPVDNFLQIELHGALNPAIFRPTWFSDQGLLRPAEAEKAEISADTDDFVQFQLPDLLIDVNREQFTLVSRNESLSLTHRDMVANMFELLPHTPIRGMTVSRAAWFAPPVSNASLDWTPVAGMDVWKDLLPDSRMDRVTVLGPADVGEFAAELTVEDSGREREPLLIRCIYSRFLGEGTHQVGAELEKDWVGLYNHSNRVMNHLNTILWHQESTS